MRRIMDRGGIRLAHNALMNVFQHCDPFNAIYSSEIQRKAILCETESNLLNREQFTALCVTARSIGDEIALITDCVDSPTPQSGESQSEYWSLPLTEESFDDYGSGRYSNKKSEFAEYSVLEHVIISPGGSWGILTSYEHHAVMGGSESFMTVFENNYRDFSLDLKRFYELWQYNLKHDHSNVSWIRGLLENVYGDDLPVEAPSELLAP